MKRKAEKLFRAAMHAAGAIKVKAWSPDNAVGDQRKQLKRLLWAQCVEVASGR
jgi:hypothetical protein